MYLSPVGLRNCGRQLVTDGLSETPNGAKLEGQIVRFQI